MSVDLKLCRCNIAPKTIVRGPGFLNAALVAEHVLEHVAQHLNLDPVLVRETNFLTSLSGRPQQLPSTAADMAAVRPVYMPLAREAAVHDDDAPGSTVQASEEHQQLDTSLPGDPSSSRSQLPDDSDKQQMASTGISDCSHSRRDSRELHHKHATARHARTLKSPMNPPQQTSGLTASHHQSPHAASAHYGHTSFSSCSAAVAPGTSELADSQACSASTSCNVSLDAASSSSSQHDALAGAGSISGTSNAALDSAPSHEQAESAARCDGLRRTSAATGFEGSSRPGVPASSCTQHGTAASFQAQEMPSTAGGRMVNRPCQPAKRIAPEDDLLQPGDVRTPLGT